MHLKNETILGSGLLLLSVGILIGEFTNFEFSGVQISEFMEGFFVGLAIVMEIAYMIRIRVVNKTSLSAKV